MLTRRLFVSLLLIGGGDPDCRYLWDNAITELAATLFDKLTNLRYLYVPRTIAIECCSDCRFPLWTVLLGKGRGIVWVQLFRALWRLGLRCVPSSKDGALRVCERSSGR